MTSIDSLPTEMLQRIFGHCSRNDLKAISAVCHRWADVALPAMLQWTSLKLSYGILRPYRKDYTRCTQLIGKRTLQKLDRPYTCLSIEWRNGETMRNMRVLSGLLNVCEGRFVVQRLFLKAPPNTTLVQFFEQRREWLKDIVELHVTLEPANLLVASVYEMSFPHLRQLTWREQAIANSNPGSRSERHSNSLFESWHGFALDAPELCRLEVGLNVCLMRNSVESRLQNPTACVLFLPTLELVSYPKLESITVKGLYNLSQSRIDDSERCLQNLTELTFDQCHSDVIVKICEKCSNLKELTIDSPLDDVMSLQISPTLSSELEHLTIKCSDNDEDSYLDLHGEAVFSKLQGISLNQVYFNNVTLIAPQLTMCNTLSTNHSELKVPHNTQIRTLKVQVQEWIIQTVPPPPNVTELFLQLAFYSDYDRRAMNRYLEYFAQLRRLAIFDSDDLESDSDSFSMNSWSDSDGEYDSDEQNDSDNLDESDESDDLEFAYDPDDPLTLDCAFAEGLPHLEHFAAYRLTIRLIDIERFAGLKSLILSNCTLKTKPKDKHVSLTALEYVRMYHVQIDGARRPDFPIRVNERQPPIELVESYDEYRYRRKIFSSRNFKEPSF